MSIVAYDGAWGEPFVSVACSTERCRRSSTLDGVVLHCRGGTHDFLLLFPKRDRRIQR